MERGGNLRYELFDLALKAGSGLLSEVDEARLVTLIESSDEACRQLLLSAMLDADLAFHARAAATEDRVAEVIALRRAPTALHDRRAPRRGRWLAVAAAVSVAAAAAFFSTPREQPLARIVDATPIVAERQPQPIATMTAAPGAEFGSLAAQVDDAFFEGDRVELLEGELHVSMSSGADFVLTAPGELEFISAKEVQLNKGVLTAQVAEWGTGFTVDTKSMRVIDLGTQFAVDASGADVETHVLKGQVRVQPLAAVDGRRSMLLSEGQAIRVDGIADHTKRIKAELERFPAAFEDFDPFKPIKLFNTGAGLAEGDEDPNWRITAGPIGAGYRGPQFGVVCVPDVRYAPNEVDKSQWVSVAKELRPGGLPRSVFTFATNFDTTGFDLSTIRVAAQVLADNGVREMRINGERIPMKAWDDNVPEQKFTRNRFRLIEIERGFVPGINTLEFDVWNGIYQGEGVENEPNPVALRVELQAFGRLAEPAPRIAGEGLANAAKEL